MEHRLRFVGETRTPHAPANQPTVPDGTAGRHSANACLAACPFLWAGAQAHAPPGSRRDFSDRVVLSREEPGVPGYLVACIRFQILPIAGPSQTLEEGKPEPIQGSERATCPALHTRQCQYTPLPTTGIPTSSPSLPRGRRTSVPLPLLSWPGSAASPPMEAACLARCPPILMEGVSGLVQGWRNLRSRSSAATDRGIPAVADGTQARPSSVPTRPNLGPRSIT